MNKEAFIAALEQQLLRLPKADRDDILSDYEAHFAAGLEDGKTEEEVSAALGDPSELAATYMENLPQNAKGAPYVSTEQQPVEQPVQQPVQQPYYATTADGQYGYTGPTYSTVGQQTYQSTSFTPPAGASVAPEHDRSTGIAIVVLLSLFVAIPIIGAIIGFWFGVLGGAIGAAAGSVALFIAGIAGMLANTALSIGMILLGAAAMALAALLVIGLIAMTKGVIALIKWYIEQCKKIIEGGVN